MVCLNVHYARWMILSWVLCIGSVLLRIAVAALLVGAVTSCQPIAPWLGCSLTTMFSVLSLMQSPAFQIVFVVLVSSLRGTSSCWLLTSAGVIGVGAFALLSRSYCHSMAKGAPTPIHALIWAVSTLEERVRLDWASFGWIPITKLLRLCIVRTRTGPNFTQQWKRILAIWGSVRIHYQNWRWTRMEDDDHYHALCPNFPLPERSVVAAPAGYGRAMNSAPWVLWFSDTFKTAGFRSIQLMHRLVTVYGVCSVLSGCSLEMYESGLKRLVGATEVELSAYSYMGGSTFNGSTFCRAERERLVAECAQNVVSACYDFFEALVYSARAGTPLFSPMSSMSSLTSDEDAVYDKFANGVRGRL